MTVTLWLATWEGDVTKIDAAIRDGADPNSSDELVGPPIVGVAGMGNYDAVKLLLDKGANVNATDSEGRTALINAAFIGNTDVVRLLLLRGADVNASFYPLKDGERGPKFTALRFAELRKNDAVIKLLKDAGARE